MNVLSKQPYNMYEERDVRNLHSWYLVKMTANHLTHQGEELGAPLIKSGLPRVRLLANLTCVYSNVLVEIESLFEIFATNSAPKVTFAVQLHMNFKIILCLETLHTFWT